ncbi:hypothetical protein T310_3512 [Rasamsonia emersonii CBS 393.64]|uniref:Nucleoside transporter n=1 Tax=Rasamsonia emersonii (strain ATCC 16479 / CBS 393.64 / IMI 116815) TaxID=1408163 RepID=A0A0F4YXT1_RASE3|nr:hypothetical protein T310_3512 [Rasamsonia emersonii CBS 393.64]KKA22433.1 hypothetical protein T310_3512 [Rasamsonia emersonii CBS 393.64]
MDKDLEKSLSSSAEGQKTVNDETPDPDLLKRDQWLNHLESITGIESRGIERVPPDERYEGSFVQMLLLWLSANLTANNTLIGVLGPVAYGLGFTDAALCAVFGGLLGCVGVAYVGTWGPRNRREIFHGLLSQPDLLPAQHGHHAGLRHDRLRHRRPDPLFVSDGRMTVIVGIIVVAIVSWLVATFGMRVFQTYERYSWLPQAIVLAVMAGTAGPKFDVNSQSIGSAETINANRLSFFSLAISCAIAWAPAGADYYVYYPANSPRWKIFLMSFVGLGLAIAVTLLLGVGVGSAIQSVPEWQDAYNNTPGNLLEATYLPVNSFGKFCAVVAALGVIANNIPGTYSAALAFQILGRYGLLVPRSIWTIVCVIIYTACALGGRNYLFDIFENFLPLMGYWIVIWLTIMLEEDLIFRRGKPYDWEVWHDRKKLPLGIAAFTAFVIGWVGAIIGMVSSDSPANMEYQLTVTISVQSQVYYIGPIARAIAGGCDLGIYLGIGFTFFAYPPLRVLELWKIGR